MVLGWTAGILLFSKHLQRGMGPWWAPFTLWVLHAAGYLSCVMVARIFFGYVGPSVLTTSWGIAIYMHAFLSVIGGAVVTRRFVSRL